MQTIVVDDVLPMFSAHLSKTVSPRMANSYLGDQIQGFVDDCGSLGSILNLNEYFSLNIGATIVFQCF